jgi:hypothetical protein
MACMGKARALHLENNPKTPFDPKSVSLPDLIRRPHAETDELKALVSTLNLVDMMSGPR